MALTLASLLLPQISGANILAAISGGLDSVVLLHLLHLRGAKTGVAHCNFGLRGHESDGDEEFVRKLAKRYNFPFYRTGFCTLQHAEENGISTQMAARELRYTWFEEIRRQHQFDFIATAHHLNDSLETVLLNLLRGTGPAGLRGIAEEAGNIIRPLINTSREEITEFARHHNLTWREDSSNQSDYYKRNFLRQHIIPQLQQLNPNLLQTMSQTMQRMTDATELIRDKAAEVKKQAVTDLNKQVWIKTGLLPKKGLPLLLHELIKKYGFSYLQATEISKNLNAHSGKQHLSPTHRLLIDRQQLIISPLAEPDQNPEYKIEKLTTELDLGDHKLLFGHFYVDDFAPKKSADVAALDADKLNFPLRLRKWQPGDKFRPLGMRGQKKVSDFLIDQKVPVTEKEHVYVLVSGSEIVWLVGYRIGDRCKISAQTKNILEARLLKK